MKPEMKTIMMANSTTLTDIKNTFFDGGSPEQFKARLSQWVDDFGIKYFTPTDANHLLDALRTKYSLTTDWTGSSYLGFKIDWNYPQRHVDISMPEYVPKALLTLRHPHPTVPQHAPHQWTRPVYGAKIQLANTDISPLLDKLGIHRVQQISGLFLYYSRGCDPTIIVALNEISHNQAAPTEKTKKACDMLLD